MGCGLAVVHDRLYVSGGVDERVGFDSTVARWDGHLPHADGRASDGRHKAASAQAASRDEALDYSQPWTHVDGLDLQTAMHAHSALTVPMLP